MKTKTQSMFVTNDGRNVIVTFILRTGDLDEMIEMIRCT